MNRLTYLSNSKPPVKVPALNNVRSSVGWLPIGEDDQFFELLYNLSLSPTQSAVLDKKLLYTLGTIEYDRYWDRVSDIPVNQLVRRIMHDYIVYNTFALFVDLEPHRTITETGTHTYYDVVGIRPVSPRQIRRAVPTDPSLEAESYYYSWDFTRFNLPEFRPVQYARFDSGMVGASCDMDDPLITTVYYYDGNIVAPNLYPLPTYIGALVDMLADQSASNFRYRTLANGFAVVATLKIPNEALTDVERIETERRLIQRYAGDTGDPLMFLYGVPSTNGEIAYPELEYQPIPDISGVYSEISRDTLFKILLAHQIPPVLAGFTESGGIASEGAAIVAAAKLFELTFAKNARTTVCDALRYIVPNPISIEPLDLSSLL